MAKRSSQQERLPGTDVPRVRKLADFDLLPPLVRPTPFYVLEQGGDLLIYRNADAAKKLTAKQRQIAKKLARLGSPCKQCGHDPDVNIQVLVATGQAGMTFDREVAHFDHVSDGQFRQAETSEIQGFIADWFGVRANRH